MGAFKRLAVLGLFMDFIIGFGTVIGIGWGCALDNTEAFFFGSQLLIVSSFIIMLVGYNKQNEARGSRICAAGLAVFALAMVTAFSGFGYKAHGEWQPLSGVRTAQVTSLQLSRSGPALDAEDTERVMELLCQVTLRNPVMDPEYTPWPEEVYDSSISPFYLRINDERSEPQRGEPSERSYRLAAAGDYYIKGGNCFAAANPEVSRELQGLYRELAAKYNDSDALQTAYAPPDKGNVPARYAPNCTITFDAEGNYEITDMLEEPSEPSESGVDDEPNGIRAALAEMGGNVASLNPTAFELANQARLEQLRQLPVYTYEEYYIAHEGAQALYDQEGGLIRVRGDCEYYSTLDEYLVDGALPDGRYVSNYGVFARLTS